MGYSENGATRCPKHENYCAGGNGFGSGEMQALAVKEAIEKGGEHPMCPLIYPGTE